MATKDPAEMTESERQREAARIRKAIAGRRVALDRSDTENALALEALEAEAVELERFGERQRLRDAAVRREAFKHSPRAGELKTLREHRGSLAALLEQHSEKVREAEAHAAATPEGSYRPGLVESNRATAQRRLPQLVQVRDRVAAQLAEVDAELAALEQSIVKEWVKQ